MASMQTKLRRKQRRKPSGLPFVQQHKYMLRWSAWRSLSPIERAAYIQLALRYDGVNNGSPRAERSRTGAGASMRQGDGFAGSHQA
jgi:hypothetical protein